MNDLHVHVHIPGIKELTAVMKAVDRKVSQLIGEVAMQSKELDQLEKEVTKNTEVDQSAIALLNGLATQIQSMKNDPAKLQALADSLKASSENLAAAVVANTPAEDTGAGSTGDTGTGNPDDTSGTAGGTGSNT